MESLKELVNFLHIGARQDLKSIAVSEILKLSGNNKLIEDIVQFEEILKSLLSLTNDTDRLIAKDAYLTLINISAFEKGAFNLVNLDLKSKSALLASPKNIVETCLNEIVNPESEFADPACMIISNLTRPTPLTDKIVDLIEQSSITFDKLINIFTKIGYNTKGAKLHYLGPTLSNLTQSSRVRKYILDRNKCVIQRLLPFTQFEESIVRRGGIVGTLRNCCFEEDSHEWLLGDDVEILSKLLLPLAGNEEFDDEDNDKLPLELQYLPEDKKREDDPDIRRMLLEAITHLCSLKKNREFVRDCNTYVILRELHKWEKDRPALLACENLVDILIRTEEEIAKDNLKDAEVPEDLVERFEKMDKEFVENS